MLQNYSLTILVLISLVAFITGCPLKMFPNNYTIVRNNSEVELTCANNGKVLFWTKNGVSLTPGIEGEVCDCQLQPCGNLVFENISETDAGENVYRCTIFADNKFQMREARICIEELPVFEGDTDYEGTEGESLTIEIIYSGTCGPIPNIDLLRNAISVANDTNIRVQVVDSKVEIVFTNLRLSDQGLHTLRSDNLAGTSISRLMINVKHPPVLADKGISPGTIILANTTATLSCNYTGYPEVTVRWYDPYGSEINSGILISRDPQFNWIYSQLNLPMQIDGGSYTCRGVNTVGNTDNTITFEVTGPLESPEITEISANEVTVSWAEPSSAYMINRYRVEYRKNTIGATIWQVGREVMIGTNRTIIADLQGFTSYLIRVVYFADQGTYLGTPIQIRTLSRAPTFPPRFLRSTTVSSSSIELNWIKPERSFSDGVSEITSYRVWWGKIQENSQLTYTFDTVDGSVISYTLQNLSPGSRYSIKVQANTIGGPGPNTTRIEVTTLPDTIEPPLLLLNTRREQVNWIVEWELSGIYFSNIYFYVRLSDSSGEILEEIGPFPPDISSYNFSYLDSSTYYLICVEMEFNGELQSRNCTEINLMTREPITIASLNLAIWIATPVAGVILMVCVLSALLCGLAYGCRTKREYKKTNVKKTTSDISITSKFSMTARHPYTGEPLPLDPEAPKSCLKYHSDRGENHHIKFPKQLRIGTDL